MSFESRVRLIDAAGQVIAGDNPLVATITNNPARELGRVTPPETWVVTQLSAAGAAQTIVRAAVAGQRHYIQGFEVTVAEAATTASIAITLEFGAAVVWRTRTLVNAAVGARIDAMFPYPLAAPVDQPVTLRVTAGSAGVITEANLTGMTLAA